MQTAKNVFLWPGRDWLRKGFEVVSNSEEHRSNPGRRQGFDWDGPTPASKALFLGGLLRTVAVADRNVGILYKAGIRGPVVGL
jgi:hypothetical protein